MSTATIAISQDSRNRDSRVEDYLNDKFQTLGDLESLEEILNAVRTQQSQLRTQLQAAETRAEKARTAASEHSHSLLIQAQLFQQNQDDIDRRLQATTTSDTVQNAAAKFEASMEKLRRLDVAKGYVSLILQVQELSDEARKGIQKDPKLALVPYNKLQRLSKELRSRHEEMENAAVHLVDYVEKTTALLWDEMKNRLAEQFGDALNKIGWPTANADVSNVPGFAKDFEKLLALQEPEIETGLGDKPLLPMELLVKPLELRFRYHFEGDRQTNRIDKPEWFLSHLSSLVTTYTPFLLSVVQPLLTSSANPRIAQRDAVNEFVTALLPVLRRKIHHLLPQILDQAQLLSHFIHEMIKFDAELRGEFGYMPYGCADGEWKGVTHEVLVVEGGFVGWIKVEKEFALSRYHNILDAEDAWVIDYESVEPKETKPTKSAIRVRDLLETVTDRYRPLTSFTQRLRFLIDIQISILDQYHDRLHSSIEAFKMLSSSIARAVQGTSKEEVQSLTGIGGLERLCKVYGSAMFLENCMKDWGEDIFFLELWEELQERARKAQRNNATQNLAGTMNVQEVANVTSSAVTSGEEDGALFDETAGSYKALRTTTEDMIVDLLIGSIKEELRSYSKITLWSSITSDSSIPSTISPEMVQPATTTNTFLSFLFKTVVPAVFKRVYRKFAAGIQAYLWDNILMHNQFSLAGGKQFTADIDELWNVSRRYIGDPEASMKRVKAACVLLTLEEGQEEGKLGLKEVVQRVFEDNEKARVILEELGLVGCVSISEARGVLQRRVEAWA
ncbi:TIP-1 family-domain-containing protein [Tuber borchii]|uniref:TIP-1 family-domain-containing protein n=1 Tax=Tuber borchii TaxID=42251 RepID=A0A2T6ZSL6_TUBBO|nr:TIP-1 family-domain-containing protein [Tuber borchii]